METKEKRKKKIEVWVVYWKIINKNNKQNKKMLKMLENVMMHEVVTVFKKSKDQDKSWRNSKTTGVVIEKSEEELSVIGADGREEKFDLHEVDYDYEVVPFSEVLFLQQIDKEIDYAKRSVADANAKLAGVEKWRKDFVLQISLLGKLYRLALQKKLLISTRKNNL